MAGGLLQLVSVGAQDVFLTSNPKVTFFKVLYRRHTIFAVESIEQFFKGTIDFGRQGIAELSRSGDLVSQAILRVVLPNVVFSGDFEDRAKAQFAWVKNIGHALIDEVSFDIGGTTIDKQYGAWMNIWKELSLDNGKKAALSKMLGDVPELTSISTLSADDGSKNTLKKSYPLYIPLQFYFCRNYGLALPLVALQYHQVILKVKFRPFHQLAIMNEATAKGVGDLKLDDTSLYVDFIYLDDDERQRFAQKSHEYLIEQTQHTSDSVTNTSVKSKLSFNHPVKSVTWVTSLGNYQGGRFMSYEPDNWEKARDNAAKKLLLSQYDLDSRGIFNAGMGQQDYVSINPIHPNHEASFIMDTSNVAKYFASGKNIGILDGDVVLMGRNGNDLRHKVAGVIRICMDEDGESLYPVVDSITRNDLTMCDLSVVVDKYLDNRNDYISNMDLIVWQHHNYGMLIDGTVNPVLNAEIHMNGQLRQSKRDGTWYDTVVPYMSHTNTPPPGVNVMSFALKPEEHQPSGSCNFSRIDSPQLTISFGADGASPADINDIFAGPNNQVHTFAVNYNVLRLLSGMGGLAYAN